MDKLELLQKIKALAEMGVNGEAKNTQIILEKLMKKYGINDAEIEEDKINIYPIKWRGFKSKALAIQVFFSIIEDDKTRYFFSYKNRQSGELHCTSAEFLEWQAKYQFYQHHLNNDLEIFYTAFIQRNKIFGKLTQCEESYKLTESDLQALLIAESLNKHDYTLQIEQK